MKREIYKLKSYKEAVNEFDLLSFDEKYKIINYLFITGNNDNVFELLKKLYSIKLSNKEKRKVDYLQLIYHINNEDEYNIDTIKYQLIKENRNEEWYYNIISERNIEKKLEIFKKLLPKNKLKKYFRNKKYKKNIIYVYLMNFGFLEEPIRINFIEKYINRNLKKLNRKKELRLDEISYVEQISNIIFGNLSFIYIKNNEYFIDFIEYKKLIEKVITEKKKYKDFSKSSNVEFNTIMYCAIRDMINLDFFDTDEKRNMAKFLDEFLNENINEIDDSIRITKQIYSGDFWNGIEKVLNDNKDEVNLIDLIMNNISFSDESLEEIYDKLDQLISKYNEKNLKHIIQQLVLCKELVNLWLYGSFNREKFKNIPYKISDFSALIIKFFNKEIEPEDFIFELNGINRVDCFEIINWRMLEEKCEIFDNYEWLLMILDRINTQLDKKSAKYFQNFYIDILSNKRVMFLNDFVKVNNVLVRKFDYNYFFLVNSTNILIQFYEDYKDAENLIEKIVNNWERIKLKEKKSFYLHILIVIVEQNLTKVNIKKLKSILIDDMDTLINKSFVLLYLNIVYKDIVISENEYKDILKYIIDKYKNLDDIEDILYRIIASFAMKYEKNRNIINLSDYDTIYYKDGKHYHLETEDKILNEGFELLDVGIIDKDDILQNTQNEHLLMFFICRIFFSKIEEKGIGKQISVSSNATAKELLLELNKALGTDIRTNKRKQVRDGNFIDVPWLNIYEYNSLFEDIVSSKWKIFNNVHNNKFLSTNKIIHLSSVILLAKIDRLDVLEKNECYVSFSIYDETIKRNNKEVVELGRGILEEAIFYDKELSELATTLEILNKNKHIFNVSEAMLLPRQGLNRFDDDIVKLIIEKINVNGDFCLITEDPYWLNTNPFSDISESIISLLIDSLKNNLITPKELLDSMRKLNDIQYNMDIGNVLYNYLLTKSDDENIKQIINIINNYKLK